MPMKKPVYIRAATDEDLSEVLSVERLAFAHDTEAELVRVLLDDPSAKPFVSLLAFTNDRAVGHILFTAARLTKSDQTASIAILAPLAIVPDAQKQGIGGMLIARGFQLLSKSRVDLVFVLGHPAYYPRYGFKPAGYLGFEAPHPIPDEHADAWMVHALQPGVIGTVRGKVMCADALNQPEYWRE